MQGTHVMGAHSDHSLYQGYKENDKEKEWSWRASSLQLYAGASLAAGDAKQRLMKPRNLGSTGTELLPRAYGGLRRKNSVNVWV